MPHQAAGIVLYRRDYPDTELLLGHLGGPYFARKDKHGWVVPKGLVEPGESLLEAAQREWTEETGAPPPAGDYLQLPVIKQSGNKHSTLFLVAGDVDARTLHANPFTLEWPPRSGKQQTFPELDRYDWFGLEAAEQKLVKGLLPLVRHVREALRTSAPPSA